MADHDPAHCNVCRERGIKPVEPKRYVVRVIGSGTTGSFGGDSHLLTSPADLLEDDRGNLVVKAVAWREDRLPYTTIYARGRWSRVTITERSAR